ncbi:hypothetical protein PAEAM_63120 [Paenibacillus sp. GM1FR]|nr:hypothetical protein PAEAM_63120 [Paenibacillus sp. GM1FR]
MTLWTSIGYKRTLIAIAQILMIITSIIAVVHGGKTDN